MNLIIFEKLKLIYMQLLQNFNTTTTKNTMNTFQKTKLKDFSLIIVEDGKYFDVRLEKNGFATTLNTFNTLKDAEKFFALILSF